MLETRKTVTIGLVVLKKFKNVKLLTDDARRWTKTNSNRSLERLGCPRNLKTEGDKDDMQ